MPSPVTADAIVLLLVLGTALGWALLDLLRKCLASRIDATPQAFFLTCGQVPLLVAWWLWRGGELELSAGYLLTASASVALNVVAILGFITALKVSPLSVTIPLLSLTPVCIALVAMPILGEYPSPRQWLGIALVVAGALLLNVDFGGGRGVGELVRAFARERGTRLMGVVAFAWSLTLPLDKLSIERSSPAQHGLLLTAAISLAMLALLAARGRLGDVRQAARAPRLVAAAIVANAVALVFQLLAMERVLVGLLETFKRGLGSFIALVLGAVLFGEPVTAPKAVAVALMAVGVALVLL